MKLIFCPKCQDVKKLQDEKTTCKCGQSWGRYLDDVNAEIGGNAVLLGIDNSSFAHALKYRVKKFCGVRFIGFVIEEECPTVKVIEK
jgi:hypothetical protein